VLITPPLFHPNLGVFPLDLVADVGGQCEQVFEVHVFQPMLLCYRNVTDGQPTYCGMTALCVA